MIPKSTLTLFIYLFGVHKVYFAFNTVQVISRQVVGRAEETSTYSWPRFCTVNCRPTASNYQLSHLRPYRTPASEVGGERVTTLPPELTVTNIHDIKTSYRLVVDTKATYFSPSSRCLSQTGTCWCPSSHISLP